jgi:hypothetical protein
MKAACLMQGGPKNSTFMMEGGIKSAAACFKGTKKTAAYLIRRRENTEACLIEFVQPIDGKRTGKRYLGEGKRKEDDNSFSGRVKDSSYSTNTGRRSGTGQYPASGW